LKCTDRDHVPHFLPRARIRRQRVRRVLFDFDHEIARSFAGTPFRPLIDWLDYNGFTVRAKPTKEFDDGEGRRKIKRNIAIELAVDALEIAKHVDHIILFSGDGDLRALIEAVQRRGVHVTVISTIKTRPPMIADELRRQADTFLELEELRAAVGRTIEQVKARGGPA